MVEYYAVSYCAIREKRENQRKMRKAAKKTELSKSGRRASHRILQGTGTSGYNNCCRIACEGKTISHGECCPEKSLVSGRALDVETRGHMDRVDACDACECWMLVCFHVSAQSISHTTAELATAVMETKEDDGRQAKTSMTKGLRDRYARPYVEICGNGTSTDCLSPMSL
jgi:hypothetical protein